MTIDPAAGSQVATSAAPAHADIVRRIKEGESAAIADLHRLCSRGLHAYLLRQVGPEADDLLHEVLIDVVRGIRGCGIREPERLMGYIYAVARAHVAAHIGATARRRRMGAIDENIRDGADDPEHCVIASEQTAIMHTYLQHVSLRERDILTRFYLKHQTPEQIQREMNLTPTQFRLFKSRAKAHFASRVQVLLSRPLKKPIAASPDCAPPA